FEEPAIAFEEQALDFEKLGEESAEPIEMELDFGEPEPGKDRVEGEMIDFSDVNPDEPGYALEEPVGFEAAAEPAVSQNPFAEMRGASNISAASSAVKRKKKESSF